MSSQYTVYQDTDASAPTLPNAANSLVSLLDPILVTGYGAKAAAGWSKPYFGGNKAVYRQGNGSNFRYFRIDDSGGGTGGTKEALIRGFETMADIDGDAAAYGFPNAAAAADGAVVRKYSTGTTKWIAFANSRSLMLFINFFGGAGASGWSLIFLGDAITFDPTDAYGAVLLARQTQNSESPDEWVNLTSGWGAFICRSFDTLTKSVGCVLGGQFITPSDYLTNGRYHPPVRGMLVLSRAYLWHYVGGNFGVRGYLPGLWVSSLNTRDVAEKYRYEHGKTYYGTGPLSGKTFMAINLMDAAGAGGFVFVETSSTLEY